MDGQSAQQEHENTEHSMDEQKAPPLCVGGAQEEAKESVSLATTETIPFIYTFPYLAAAS